MGVVEVGQSGRMGQEATTTAAVAGADSIGDDFGDNVGEVEGDGEVRVRQHE
jgi:hypothetical protein